MQIKDLFLEGLTIISPQLSTKVFYKKRMNKKINLHNPSTFNEKIQWLKLYEYPKKSIYSICSDKYAVREYITKCGCSEILNKLIGVYDSPEEIDWKFLPNKFVLKWNFGCGLNIVCKSKKDIDEDEIKMRLKKWKNNKFYLKTSEIHYKKIKKKIICEEFLESNDNESLDDYKFYCFNGKVLCVMICVGRETGHPKFYFFDKEWKILRINKISLSLPKNFTLKKPNNIDKMFEYAEKLSKNFPFVRVDLYNVNNKIIFGELTFTPSAGLDKGYTEEGNKFLGDKIEIGGLK